MKTFGAILHFLGVIWLILFALAFVGGMGMILWKKGIGEFLAILSPFNFLNYVVSILCALPGFVLLGLADYFKGKDSG